MIVINSDDEMMMTNTLARFIPSNIDSKMDSFGDGLASLMQIVLE